MADVIVGRLRGVRPIYCKKLGANEYVAYVDVPVPAREGGTKRVSSTGRTQHEAHNRVVKDATKLLGEE